MRYYLKTDNPKNRSFLCRNLAQIWCGIVCSMVLICVVTSNRCASAAQPTADTQGQPFVRFDGREVLFLGLTNQKDILPAERMNGYDIISLACRKSESNAPQFYRFAIATTSPLERDLLADSTDGTWQRWDIIAAALVAEGVNDRQRVDAYRSKIANVVAQISRSPQMSGNERSVQTVFEALHKRVLTGKYDIACTNLAQAIDSGDFNCVSATVLFHAMAQQAGLDVCGLEMRGHALSRVRVGQRVIDLETTCADWFALSEQDRVRSGSAGAAGYDTRYFAARRQTQTPVENHSALKNSTLNHAVDNRNAQASSQNTGDPADQAPMLLPSEVPTNLREISDVQLVATIYYNRGVDELTAGRFSAATVANLKALQLDPDNENAWRNLMATFNNWAIALASKGDYLNAAQLLDEGRLVDDDYELFQANQIHTYYHWIVDLAERREYDTAMTLFRLAEDRLPNQANLRFLNYTMRRKMANEFFHSQEDGKAFAQFDAAAKIAPADINVAEAEVIDVTQHVRQLIDGNRLSRAVWLIDRELMRHATTPLSSRHVALRPVMPSSEENVGSPEMAPIFGTPLVLEEPANDGRQIVVNPRHTIVTPEQPETLEPMSNQGQPAGKTAGLMQMHSRHQSDDRLNDNQQGVPVIVSPIPETATRHQTQRAIEPGSAAVQADRQSAAVRHELVAQLHTLRADAVVAWADESLRQRDYAETIRRLTIGEPSREMISRTQVERIRQTYTDWAAALQAENRHAEVRNVLDAAARSPYLTEIP